MTLTAVSLEPGQSACPGENVTFNCIVNASQALSWGSDEYIGTGGEQLEFSYLDRIGRKIPSRINPGTFAILINVTNNSGIYSLESELYLVVDVFNQDSTISCLTIETNDSMQINILEDGMCKYNNYYIHIHARQSSIIMIIIHIVIIIMLHVFVRDGSLTIISWQRCNPEITLTVTVITKSALIRLKKCVTSLVVKLMLMAFSICFCNI